MAGMKEFFNRKEANEGRKLLLALPNGEATEDFLVVMHEDSEAYAKAIANFRKKVVESKTLAEGDESVLKEERTRLLAACVLSWSFDEPFTPENVAELLHNAPYIARAVEELVYDRKRFFGVRGGEGSPSSTESSAS